MTLSAHGAQTLGQKLAADEIAQMGALPEYDVDGIRLRVMPGATLPQRRSQQHFAPSGISVPRCADFDQAVQGFGALWDALPGCCACRCSGAARWG